MGAFRWLLPVTVTIALASASPAAAGVTPRDAAATQAYLEAKLAEERAYAAESSADLAATEALARQVKVECPGVLVGAPLHAKPLSQSAREISLELVTAALGIPERLAHPLIARFDRSIRRLRWSDARLTRLIHEFAVEQDEQSGLPPPDLCPDLKAWVASGYTATSAATKHDLHERDRISSITQIEPEPHEEFTLNVDRIIAHRLRPYENRAARLLARKLPQSKEPREIEPGTPEWHAFQTFLEAAGKVSAALETSPSPGG